MQNMKICKICRICRVCRISASLVTADGAYHCPVGRIYGHFYISRSRCSPCRPRCYRHHPHEHFHLPHCHHVYFHDYNDITFLFELIENIAQSSTYITLRLVVWSISTRLAGRTYFSLKPRSHRGLASSNVHQAIAGFTFWEEIYCFTFRLYYKMQYWRKNPPAKGEVAPMTKYRAIRSSETFHTNSLSVKAGSPNSWSVLEDQLKKTVFIAILWWWYFSLMVMVV